MSQRFSTIESSLKEDYLFQKDTISVIRDGSRDSSNLDSFTVQEEVTGVTIYGTILSEKLVGTSGNDYLSGYYGNDTLFGLEGDDELNGGANNDLLSGGYGVDTLTGGSGADTFVGYIYDSQDIITDFNELEGDQLFLVVRDNQYSGEDETNIDNFMANGDYGEDKITIDDFDIIANGADAEISYNGDSFLKLEGRADLAGVDLSSIAAVKPLGGVVYGTAAWGF